MYGVFGSNRERKRDGATPRIVRCSPKRVVFRHPPTVVRSLQSETSQELYASLGDGARLARRRSLGGSGFYPTRTSGIQAPGEIEDFANS